MYLSGLFIKARLLHLKVVVGPPVQFAGEGALAELKIRFN